MSYVARTRPAPPRWFWMPPRILLVTFIITALSFAVSLLFAIIGIVIGSRLRGAPLNLALAYRHFALPAAIVTGSIVLVFATAMELRHYRQARALAAIERTSGLHA